MHVYDSLLGKMDHSRSHAPRSDSAATCMRHVLTQGRQVEVEAEFMSELQTGDLVSDIIPEDRQPPETPA